MGSGGVFHIILPVLVALGVVLLVKALVAGLRGGTLPVRSMPLLTPMERRNSPFVQSGPSAGNERRPLANSFNSQSRNCRIAPFGGRDFRRSSQ